METIKTLAGIILTIAIILVIIQSVLLFKDKEFSKLGGKIIISMIICCILLTLLCIPLKNWFGLLWLFNTFLWISNYKLYKRYKNE